VERSVELPLTPSDRPEPPRPRPPRRRPPSRKGRRRSASAPLDLSGVTILIVEDHEDSREMLRQTIESFGAKVAVAADGREALATAGWLRPDLVLCDLRMPVLDGYGFIERLRADPALSRTAVIAVSALGSDADLRRTFEAGFDGHLVKPVDYETITAQLERIFWAHGRPQ
jgi:CheY-like chemotaxis protein